MDGHSTQNKAGKGTKENQENLLSLPKVEAKQSKTSNSSKERKLSHQSQEKYLLEHYRKNSIVSFAGDGATGAIEEKASTGGAKGSVKNSQSVVPPGEPNSKDDIEKNHLHFEVTGNQHMKLISGAALKAKRTR